MNPQYKSPVTAEVKTRALIECVKTFIFPMPGTAFNFYLNEIFKQISNSKV